MLYDTLYFCVFQGQNPLSDEATVEVYFHPSATTGFPSFSVHQFAAEVAEDVPIKHLVYTVSATSSRAGARISYQIAAGNVDNSFMVMKNGEIRTHRPLDYETTQRYTLWVEAHDNGSPSLSDFCQVTVTVTDTNDNVPLFDQLFYNVSMHENEWPPLSVIQVTANDADSGENGRVVYKLSGTGGNGAFIIDSATGQIRTDKTLDREQTDKYSLIVEATDNVSFTQCTWILLK